MNPVRLSVSTPVVITMPQASAEWEQHATVEDLATIAAAADRLGYHHLTCSEHVALPAAEQQRRGMRYWDPLATLGYLAAHTARIRLATNVLVLAYHHPLEIAKRYGTLDRVSNGRLILGVGVGSLKEEFDLLGVPFEDRGARADDALRALRASLSVAEPAYHGEFYSFDGMVVDPCAVQDHVPIWVGGRTLRSLRRAVTLADGWAPFNVTLPQAREWLSRFDLPPGFEVVLPPPAPLDPITAPDRTREILADTAAHGATIVSTWFHHHSVQHYLENLDALAELHTPTGQAPA
ncbi:LLM class F420-dependent oxidoreductase [Mycobacterium sherrisii]|uniref:LLM class F420-dependent oxidoreductase n=1 Tax=Mycobacterium sherrisii TaxID=243061 RepID=A0A1E3SY05_9MYCO|nr:LLM class F420-dependent oxidoreductase [Mycobacterium sherrisii]MCV7030006.1 LLM class F420-dependent oxidoreductase [Mycobacterium sherrisii]MEC4763396.1 LLM class F420-dependent oxidoreductase [Mycobacterium sherrisii]ODR07022.1 LLM class F420-dependent oxidoreductase [Mycobacterium sherrisii]ORW72778.1 LLM class F420-dependent oxidoreductase [Mycobacterium sherrisii]